MNDKYDITYLHITTWSGIAFLASHYYGKLYHGDDTPFELCKKLTKKQADELNKRDIIGCIAPYHINDMTQRFDTEDEIIRVAKREYKKRFPESNVLVLGNPIGNKIKRILQSPKGFKIKE